MDKNQRAKLLQVNYSKLCEKIDEDYKEIKNKIKKNGSMSAKQKGGFVEEIRRLLSSYELDCENNWRKLENYWKVNNLEKYFDIAKARQGFVSHEHKLIKLKQKLEKEIVVKKSDDNKPKRENKNNLSKNQIPDQNNICWECHKTNSEKWYINQQTGLEFCSQVCNLEHNAELCENCVQKCLKYENGVAVDFQSFYKDNEKKTGTLCFACKQKQRKNLESELERLQQDQKADKEEREKLKKLIKSNSDKKDLDDSDTNIDNPNINNNDSVNDFVSIERERERERQTNLSQQSQLLSQITQLESNPTQNQSELNSKKQQLAELQTKEKELTKSLPLNTQITILEKDIKELENKPTKTQIEQTLLDSKKQELDRLLEEKNKSDTTEKPSNNTILYISLGIVGVVLIGLVILLFRKKK